MSINTYFYPLDIDEPQPKKGKLTPKAEKPQETTSLSKKARNHFCDECRASFTCPTDLTRHIDTVHLKIKRFICSICIDVGRIVNFSPMSPKLVRTYPRECTQWQK